MIDLDEVGKEYRSVFGLREGVRALDGVSFRIEPGTALGVVGLNGAGKSTLLRILMGYARPSSGTVAIDGQSPRDYAERNGIAYLPERVTIPPGWSVEQALRAYAMFAGIGEQAWERVGSAIERVGLTAIGSRRVGQLSKGNLQRLAIAQAILGDRKVMVLDEPTDGLDPLWIVELREIISEWRTADPSRVLVLASHNLQEVERLTDRVILLHNGLVRGDLPASGDSKSLEGAFLQRVADLEEARP